MIRVIVEDRGHWLTEAGATVAEIIQRFKNEHSVHFVNGYTFRETQLGRELPPEEIPLDHHVYYLTAWTQPA